MSAHGAARCAQAGPGMDFGVDTGFAAHSCNKLLCELNSKSGKHKHTFAIYGAAQQ
jgi:hypothetical protein